MLKCLEPLSRKLQFLGLGLMIRLCITYVVISVHYDFIYLGDLMDFVVLNLMSFRTYCYVFVVFGFIVIAVDVFTLAVTMLQPYVAIRWLIVTSLIHFLIVVPLISFSMYLGFSSDRKLSHYDVGWKGYFTDLADACNAESSKSSDALLEIMITSYKHISNVQQTFQCCGWNMPDDYYIDFCPQIHMNDSAPYPWWAENSNQKYAPSCCPLPHYGDNCTLGTKEMWYFDGCSDAIYPYLYRILLTSCFTYIAAEIFSLITQIIFVILMWDAQESTQDSYKLPETAKTAPDGRQKPTSVKEQSYNNVSQSKEPTKPQKEKEEGSQKEAKYQEDKSGKEESLKDSPVDNDTPEENSHGGQKTEDSEKSK
ncbi:unnamed protein product [Bursaphelenchus okinawaensis]|uniref:Tetraspanin n=1 Tax=Bursaphelenchus okinawaensis TaxID=465554 RepID=A0A811L338_9BILA|nr:unnamed protein product [Bursaphelenchus okinawaensis]CAG9116648.1 unnamed protein product [Bursaphelenchus okinawaensis]